MKFETWMLTLSVAMLAGCAGTGRPTDGVIALKSVRGYHVGGERKTLSGLPVKEIRTNPQAPIRKSDPNGDYQFGQLYVQHFALASPKAKVPVLLWHGGGLSGVTWETTPDGRAGAGQPHRHDHLVLQPSRSPMSKRRASPPRRWSDLRGRDDDAGLLAQLPDRRVEVGLTGVDPAAGQLPPRAKLGVVRVAGVEEQELVAGIEHDQPHHAALDDRQVPWHLDQWPNLPCPVDFSVPRSP